ncbi:MAG TPA: putative baseplate assembly protein [Solirubrobacteraceae bacterium]|jgi:predicted phage baseplate assembly protein|nr:putative baseplate assembly protein [Solirubrobacteraceae bacterium]
MTLPTVNLDDRRFQDIVSDARRRIAQTCPEWTEHNVSDPGITLIELFAWMTDMLVYRVNRLPDKLHTALLELLGIRLAPAVPATTLVRFLLSAPAEESLAIAAYDTQIATRRTAAGRPIVFQVRDDFRIAPIRPSAYVIEHDAALRSIPVIDGDARPHGTDQRPFGSPPKPDDAFYVGFADPLGRLVVRVTVDALQARGAGVDPADPPLVWEVAQGPDVWAEAEILTDTTGGFNFGSGVIDLQLPRRSAIAPVAGQRGYWLRCRLIDRAGTGSEDAYSHPPEIKLITARAIGAVLPATHSVREVEESLGYSDGTPAQSLKLLGAPALGLDPTRETLEVLEPGAELWQRWEQRESFEESGPFDRHFVFDAAAGEVQLGPAIRHPGGGWTQHGAIPVKGAGLRISAYRHGGGREGNVAAGTLSVLRRAVPGVATVTNPQPARGGLDQESLEAARHRTTFELRTRYRAVTTADFEFLARDASPQVGRTYCVEAPGDDGAIVIYVLAGVAQPDRHLTATELMPDRGLLSQVAAYLDERRTLGTTVHLAAARLRRVSVVVNVEVAPGADGGRVEIDVRQALYRYLNPLIGGSASGPGSGWGFGRPLVEGELYGIVQAVLGVEQIVLLRVYEADAADQRARRPVGNQLTIEPHELIVSETHTVKATRRTT